jgi:hypothetical protein
MERKSLFRYADGCFDIPSTMPHPADRERYFRNQPHRVPLGYHEYAGDKQFATTLARGIELLRCFTARDTAAMPSWPRCASCRVRRSRA